MGNHIKEDNYPDFGKRRTIPGLKNEKLHYPKNKIGSNIQLFSSGRYDSDGVNGGFVGLKGDVSIYDRGELELYGGVGNIAAAGAKFSHSIWENDNFAVKGYARAEGAVDLFNKKEFVIEQQNDIQETYDNTTSVIGETQGEVVDPEDFYYYGEGHYDTDIIYHKTDVINQYELDIENNANLKGDFLASGFKTAIGGEVTFTNDKGNLEFGLSGEIGLKGQRAAKSDYNQGQVTHNTTLNSAEYNDDAVWGGVYDGLSNLQSDESITIDNRFDLGGFETKLGFDSNLYGAINGRVNYRAGRFGLDLNAGIDYSNQKFTPNFKAGVSYILGDSPKMYNHGARILFKKNPLSNEELYLDSKYPEAELDFFTKAQAVDGVNGLAAGLEGKVPLNNIGTDLNISAGVGNFITADVNLSQTNPVVNNDWQLKGSIGAKIDYSLTKKNTYTVKDILSENESDYYTEVLSTNEILQNNNLPLLDGLGRYNSSRKYKVHETNKITITNEMETNASSIKAYGSLGINYIKDNWTIGTEIEGGLKNKDLYPELSSDLSQFEYYSSGYSSPNFDPRNPEQFHQGFPCICGIWIVHNPEDESVITTGGQLVQYILDPTDGYPEPGAYVHHKLVGDTRLTYKGDTNGYASYTPKFKPYVNLKLGGEYNFDNKNSIRGEVNYDGELGGQIVYTRKIR